MKKLPPMSFATRKYISREFQLKYLYFSGFFFASCLGACSAHQSRDPTSVYVFDTTTKLVEEKYFDSEFNGLNWRRVKKRYRALAEKSANEDVYSNAIGPMLALLESSHTNAIGPLVRNANRARQGSTVPLSLSRCSGISIYPGRPGVSAHVTGVRRSSIAWKQGVRPGWRISETLTDGTIEFLDDAGKAMKIKFPSAKSSEKFDFFIRRGSVNYNSHFADQRLGVEGFFGQYGDVPTVAYVRMDGPAYKEGIRPGDRIFSISDRMVNSDYRNISISVNKNEQIVRSEWQYRCGTDVINNIVNFTHEMTDGNLFSYIRFDRFSDDSVEKISNAFNASGANIIIDLRWNSGGSATALQRLLGSMQLSDRPFRIGYISRRGVREEIWTLPKSDKTAINPKPKKSIVVFIGGMTQSAAEVFATVLRSSFSAKIIGRTSAGNVQVSRSYDLPDGGLLQIAEGEFLDNSGNKIENIGVTPDFLADQYDGKDMREVCLSYDCRTFFDKK